MKTDKAHTTDKQARKVDCSVTRELILHALQRAVP